MTTSFDRKVSRAGAKAAYKRFSDAWRAEKAYQLYQVKQNKLTRDKVLGRRPTFSMWMKAVKNKSAFDTKPEIVDEHISEVWGDEPDSRPSAAEEALADTACKD